MTLYTASDEEKQFEDVLKFLRNDIPKFVAVADLSLKGVQTHSISLVGRIQAEVKDGKSVAWMSAHEASQARFEWSACSKKLDEVNNHVTQHSRPHANRAYTV